MPRILISTFLMIVLPICMCPSAASASTDDVRPLNAATDFWRTSNYCGVTAVYMMLRLHGVDVPYESIRDRLPVSNSGSNLEDMRLLLRQYLPARVVKMNRQELRERCPLPCIAHIEDDEQQQFAAANRGHYVVLLRVDVAGETIELIDGTTAELKAVPTSEFLRMWSGYLLIADNTSTSTIGLLLIIASGVVAITIWAWWLLHNSKHPIALVAKRDESRAAVPFIVGAVLFSSVCRASDDVPTRDTLKVRLAELSSHLKNLIVEVKVVDEPLVDKSIILDTLNKALIKDEVAVTAFKGGKHYARRTGKQVPMPPNPPALKSDPTRNRDSERAILESYKLAQSASAAARDALARRRKAKEGSSDPLDTDMTSAFNGDELRTLESGSTMPTGSVRPISSMLENQFSSLYFNSIGLYLDDPTAKPEARKLLRSSMLPGVLDGGNSQVTKDLVDGIECLKIRGTLSALEGLTYSDTMWLDLSHGLMLRERVIADPKNERMLLRTVNSDPKEVVPGFWLPQRCLIEEFAPSSSPLAKSRGDKPLLRTVVQVIRLDANDVPDKLFDLTFPAGTQVVDLVAPMKAGKTTGEAIMYTMPANPSEVDETIRRVLTRQDGRSYSYLRLWLLITCLVIPVLILLYFFRSKRLARS